MDLLQGGEVFIPKIPSMKIIDLAHAVVPECEFETIGVRPGEKLHEILIPQDEVKDTVEYENHFVMKPTILHWSDKKWNDGKSLSEGFEYSSDKNDRWLSEEDVRKIIE